MKPRSAAQRKASVANAAKARAAKLAIKYAKEPLPSTRVPGARGRAPDLSKLARLILAVWKEM